MITGIDATGFRTEAALTTGGPDGVGAIDRPAMGNEADTITDTRKVFLNLTSLLPLHAKTLQKIIIHMMPDPIISPRFLRIYRVPQPSLEEGKVLPPKPIPHTQALIIRTDLATGLIAATTWSSSGLPLPKKSRPTRHCHITERLNIIFASVALYTHGASLLGGSAKIIPRPVVPPILHVQPTSYSDCMPPQDTDHT
jgi:hypothetical protein